MSSPQIVNPLPFEIGQYPPRDATSRPSSASEVAHGGNVAPAYASSTSQFGGASAAQSSFGGSQEGHDDGGNPVFVGGGDFEGIPTSPHNSSKVVGSDAPTPQNPVASWIKTEDTPMNSYAPGRPAHEVHSVPMPISGAKWQSGTIAYQTSATRGSMPPPSFAVSDGSFEGNHEKGLFQLSSSMDSFEHSDEEQGQYQVPPSIQVQIGNQARTTYQPLHAAPYSTSFNPRVRPIRTLSAGPPPGSANANGNFNSLGQMRQQYTPQSNDLRPVPPLSSSSSTTGTSASLQTGHFPEQRTPVTATMSANGSGYHGQGMSAHMAMEGMAINGGEAHQGGQAEQTGLPSQSSFNLGQSNDEQAWRPQTAFNVSQGMSQQQMGSSPVPIGRHPPLHHQVQCDGPSMSAPAHFNFGPSSSWQSNVSGSEVSTSAWRPNGESLMPKGFPKSPRKHICHQCDKRFNRPSSLQTHMSVHTGAKPYQCPRGDCQRRFSVSSNLRRHMRTHEAKIKKEGGSSLEPPGYNEEGEDELQDSYDIQEIPKSQSFSGEQHKYQQPFTYYGQPAHQPPSFPEVHNQPNFYGGQHGYGQPQMGHQSQQQQANAFASRNVSQSLGRSHQFATDPRPVQFQLRTPFNTTSVGSQTIPSPYSSNKQNGVRHGPSMFGFVNNNQEHGARSRQETPVQAGQ